ncbi:MAG: hypothetical protein QM296_13685 [Bacillota bacterium]|nr:hypothetical protein [Bacillota bacterium]
MNFGDFFRLLMDMTRSSISDLARTIAYDRSYVSKWYNDKLLPSMETWSEVRPQLARYFSEKMAETDFYELAELFPRLKVERFAFSDMDLLQSLLDDALKTSYLEVYPREEMLPAANVSMSMDGIHEFMAYLIDTLDRETTSMEITRDIHIHGAMLDEITAEFLDNLHFLYTSNNKYRFHFTVDSTFLANEGNLSLRKLHYFFRLVSLLPFAEFVPYLHDELAGFRCVFENIFFAYATPSAFEGVPKVFVTQHPQVLAKGKRKLEEIFTGLPCLIRMEPSIEGFSHWLSQEEPLRRPLFYLPVMPLHLAGPGLRDLLHAKRRISQADYDIWPQQTALGGEEKIRHATLLIPETAIESTTEEGLVKCSEGYLRLEGEELAAYRADMTKHLEAKEAHGELLLIPGKAANSSRLPRTAIYSDGRTAFYLPMNQIHAYLRKRLFYPVVHPALAEVIHSYLTELCSLSCNHFDL